MASSSKEQELAIKIAGKVENSFKQSLGVTEDGLNKIASVAKKAAAVAAAAFAAVKVGDFISGAVDEYAEFEQAMANTSAIAGASADDYAKLSAAAREAGKATTFTASEAADALGYMALAGWNVEESTAALTPVLKLAEATQADLATTSDQVTDSMSAMGVGIDDLQGYLDVIVTTNNKANTTAADLMDAFIGCGGAARAAGMNYKETSTALGILANNGIKGSEAGTALNSMLVRISTKDVAQKAFKDLGVAVYDSSGEMRNMRDILVDLNGAMAGMTQEQKNSYMSAIAGTNYYSQFGYLLDGVKEGVDGSASAWDELAGAIDNSTGALDTMDATATGTLQGALARFQSAISDLKISMVEDFGPYAMQIIDAVALKIPDITAGFSELIQKLPIQEFMNGVGQMAGGVLDFVGKIVDGQSFSEAFSSTLSEDFGVELPGSVQTFLGVIQNLWDDFQSFIGWIGSTAEATLGGLKDTIAEHEPQLQAIMDLLSDVQQKFSEAFEFIKGVFDGWWTTVKGVIDGVKQVFQGIIDFVAGVFTGDWSRALDGLKNIFLGAFNALKSLALAPLNALKGVVTGAFNAIDTATGGKLTAIKEKASECWNNVKQTAGTVLQAAKDTVSEKLNNMKTAYEQHGGGIKGVAAAAVEGVKGYYTAGYTFIDNLTGGKLSAIKDKFTSKMGEVKASVSEAFNNVKDTAGNLMETARANVGAKLDAMKSAYDSAGGGIKGVVAGAMAGVQSTFSSVMSTVDTLTGGKLSSITSAFTNKLNAAKTAVTNVLGNIKQAFSDKLEAAKSVVTGALDKIKGAFNFKWSLPHLNLPHISVSGGQAPYGIAGKGSLPKFSIEWYKNGGIMTQPTAFGINPESGNLMAGGEAGPEAIVPLSQLWEKMTTILKGILAESQNGGAGNALSALVDKVGAAMQGSTQTPISGLLDRLSGGGNEPQPATANGAPINYAPVYNFNGAAPTKDDLVEAERMSQAEFNEMMEQWQRDNDRKRF